MYVYFDAIETSLTTKQEMHYCKHLLIAFITFLLPTRPSTVSYDVMIKDKVRLLLTGYFAY